MFYSIIVTTLAAQVCSTATLSQFCSGSCLVSSQNQSQAQIQTNKGFPAVAVDQTILLFPSAGIACLASACTQMSSSGGGGAQIQPQQQEEKTTTEKANATSQSSDEDDYILDESGCPVLTKNMFYCMMCGGSDENGKCKGDPEYDNEFAGCDCTPDPDWSVNPPGLVRPQIREHRQAIRDRHLLRNEEEDSPGRAKNASSSGAATVAIFTQLPLSTRSALLYFASKQ